MASLRACLLSIVSVVSLGSGSAYSFVNVVCESENRGLYGRQSALQCVVRTSEEVRDVNILVVIWSKVGDSAPLLVYNKGERRETPGVGFAESDWSGKNMNVSLLVSNTKMADAGDYECMVITDSGDNKGSTRLSVTATYGTPTISSMPERDTPAGTDLALVCNSSGGYPKGQIRWFDVHDSDWTSSSELEAELRDDGLFSLSSKLTLLPGSTYSHYRCSVYNATGGKEGEATFEVDLKSLASGQGTNAESHAASKIVAPLVVIGSLIAGLLFALLLFRRRSRRYHQPTHINDLDVEGEGTRNKEIVT